MIASEQPFVIALQAWMSDDGDVQEFERGSVRSFALSGFGRDCEISDVGERTLTRVQGARYDICGEVVHYQAHYVPLFISGLPEQGNAAIDCGMRFAMSWSGNDAGKWINAQLVLSCFVDTGSEGNLAQGFPPIIYDWKIMRIERGIEADDAAGVFQPGTEVFNVERTTSDDGTTDTLFLLHCQLLGGPRAPQKNTFLQRLFPK